MTRVKKVLMTLSCPPVAYSSSSRITRLQRPTPMDGSSSMPQLTGRRTSRSWLSPGLPHPPSRRLEVSDCSGREVERSNKPTHYRAPILERSADFSRLEGRAPAAILVSALNTHNTHLEAAVLLLAVWAIRAYS